jgi:hypothetical protein
MSSKVRFSYVLPQKVRAGLAFSRKGSDDGVWEMTEFQRLKEVALWELWTTVRDAFGK